ncbi:hypothetical protein [Rhodobacter capsulatus]|jgi:hypothetical protein|uniref:Uncharacterized protein n=1 Tax=Rhodobacter phage RcapNL TaxID=1131316 RepID=H6WBR6_9CAUD|nr:hypothetical protein [Rhodobacter capsulatus]YP_007518445.1 hypothetical protein I920_gp63 [Rhodobacter phage RcapNL]AFA44903.1 hypothetical protein RcapNL_00063 [Rhodobacter phage RcapNL]ETD02898.1 hypothetical protein U714_04280 [Rhodobacter capsulatus DE442]ETD79053.1 hypothetical protein U717_04285 [Rhodobacter capsulatus R121]ETE54968.1 hypothetical protein U715_04275 [Rhodobacter capsulatus Y262]MDS0926127.1 hypothetical protein [Rhodobacter capsulatus]
MTKPSKKLQAYRDAAEAIFRANMDAITKDRKWTFEERAGTAMVVAVYCMSHAAFAVAQTDPRLKNAPMEAQIDDFLTMIRDVMVRNASKPKLAVVSDNGAS